MSGAVVTPLPSREREGPIAQRWEGEGARDNRHSLSSS
jgi:hypothetical protein